MLKTIHPTILAHMINAAFRLPYVSIRYLHDRILEEAHGFASEEAVAQFRDELAFRERSDSIDARSAYSSLTLAKDASGIPSEDADMLPPLVTGIQPMSVASFPLRFSHADAYVGEGPGARTALVGDAAHTVHPLAGQGLNMGLADAESLSKCIESALLSGGDIGT